MDLDTVAKIRRSFYRLIGTESDDPGLTSRGESLNEVADVALTAGCRDAQRWLIGNGYKGWRKRTSALSFQGSDSSDGGKYVALPSDFMQAYGRDRLYRSPLVEPDGKRWGREIHADEDHMVGDLFYFRGDQLWLARQAQPPTTLYLDYHYLHPAWDTLDDEDIDFPLEARRLIPAEGAYWAKEQNWLPRGQDMELKITRARNAARESARKVGRASKTQRRMKPVQRAGNHW